MRNTAILLVLAAGLGGCATGPGSHGILGDYAATYGSADAMAPAASLAMPSGRALAVLPAAAGPVVSVLESRRSNAVIQTIVLAGDHAGFGENKITVTALTGMSHFGASAGDPIKIAPPTDATIEEELAQAFPNIDMRIASAYDRNGQGPFGYAVGHGPGDTTCLYAWQYIGPTGSVNLLDTIGGQGPQATSVRVRLCMAHASEAELAGLVRQLVVAAPGPSQAYAGPMMAMPAGDPLAAAGAPPLVAAPPLMAAPMSAGLQPPPVSTFAAHTPRYIRHARRAPSRRVRHVARRRPVETAEPVARATGSMVPLPGGEGGAATTAPPLPVHTAVRPAAAAPADTSLPLPN